MTAPFRGIKHVVSYSGGKDSAATLGLAMEHHGGHFAGHLCGECAGDVG